MAKTKKPESKKVENEANVNGDAKPTKIVKSGFKAHASHKSVEEMVTGALKAHAKDGGVSLATIRIFIAKNFNNNKKLGKFQQQKIKDYISGEYEKGGIVAENWKTAQMNFNFMRFNMAPK